MHVQYTSAIRGIRHVYSVQYTVQYTVFPPMDPHQCTPMDVVLALYSVLDVVLYREYRTVCCVLFLLYNCVLQMLFRGRYQAQGTPVDLGLALTSILDAVQ